MSRYPQLTLDKVLEVDQDQVLVEPAEVYRLAGVYSFGRGAFERGEIKGADTAYKALFRLHEEQFVLSQLNGWEGAVDVVSTDLDGCFVSGEYPTFTIDRDKVVPGYLRWVARWPGFWRQLVPRGSMVRRKRAKPAQLLEIRIPVPPIDEQLSLVKHLDSVHQAQEAIELAFERSGSEIFADVLPACVDEVVAATPREEDQVGALVEFVADTVHPGDEASKLEPFVGLQHIESNTGRRLGSELLGEMRGRKFRFQRGDVIYGYLRPYQNKVWVADRSGLCSVDQYVMRPREGISGAALAHILRGQRVLASAIDLTHNLQLPRLRSGLLSSIRVPIVHDSDVVVVARLDRLRDRVVEIAQKRRRQAELIRSLTPAALNEMFRAQ